MVESFPHEERMIAQFNAPSHTHCPLSYRFLAEGHPLVDALVTGIFQFAYLISACSHISAVPRHLPAPGYTCHRAQRAIVFHGCRVLHPVHPLLFWKPCLTHVPTWSCHALYYAISANSGPSSGFLILGFSSRKP